MLEDNKNNYNMPMICSIISKNDDCNEHLFLHILESIDTVIFVSSN